MTPASPAPLRTRFAPSPTGDLHLGGLLCAFVSYVVARATGGAFVVRVEDLDPPRVVAGSAGRVIDDLEALGLTADEPDARGDGPCAPYTQSARGPLYEAALAALAEHTYPCDCSRRELAQAASAPHSGEELVYPGACRDKPRDRPMRRPPALRLRVPPGTLVSFDDARAGRTEQRVDLEVGDFVLRRGDGVFSYQLACAVDDHAMAIDLVARGDDLRASTPRQILLGRLLGAPRPPRYAHLPLVTTSSGERLAKRAQAVTVRALLGGGVAPEALFGFLAFAAGLAGTPEPVPLASVVAIAGRRGLQGLATRAATVPMPAAWEG